MAPQDPDLRFFSKSTPIPRVKPDLDFPLFLPNFSKTEQLLENDSHAVSRMCDSVKKSSVSQNLLKGRVTSQYTELPEDPLVNLLRFSQLLRFQVVDRLYTVY